MKVAFLMKDRPDYVQRIPKDLDWVQVYAGPDGVYPPEMLARVADVDALIGSIRDPVHEQLLAAAPKVRIVQRMGVGYDNVDTTAAAKRNIPVCNLGDVNKDALGEHGICLMLALARRLVENHRLTVQADWPGARALCDDTCELQGKTLGVLGFGKSGYELARRAWVFGMHIRYHNRSPVDARLREAMDAQERGLEELFAESDFVSVNVSLNPSTQNLVDGRLLDRMKPSAFLINLARGGIVDERALAERLDAGKLAGAGFDAFSIEPIRPDNPLLHARNVVLTSHIAGTTRECTDREVGWALANVRRYLEEGRTPRWIVNGVHTGA
ncbi:MAG TPA: NAD(P)-dependent oxidoreductase [bacterium]|nr:NAD(P)-dependent oxidoreductase [bacterium]